MYVWKVVAAETIAGQYGLAAGEEDGDDDTGGADAGGGDGGDGAAAGSGGGGGDALPPPPPLDDDVHPFVVAQVPTAVPNEVSADARLEHVEADESADVLREQPYADSADARET